MTAIDFTRAPGPRVLERLDTEQVGWLAWTGKDGAPQATPVWFLWEDDTIVVYSQPNTGKTAAIERNPNQLFFFNSDEHGGDVAVMSVTARIDTDGLPADKSPAYIEKYAGGLKSLNMDAAVFAAEYSTRIVLTPTRLRGW